MRRLLLLLACACAGPQEPQTPLAPRRCYIQAPEALAIEDVCMTLDGPARLTRYIRQVEAFEALVQDCDRVNAQFFPSMPAAKRPRSCYVAPPRKISVERACVGLEDAHSLLRWLAEVEAFKDTVRKCDLVNGWDEWAPLPAAPPAQDLFPDRDLAIR